MVAGCRKRADTYAVPRNHYSDAVNASSFLYVDPAETLEHIPATARF